MAADRSAVDDVPLHRALGLTDDEAAAIAGDPRARAPTTSSWPCTR